MKKTSEHCLRCIVFDMDDTLYLERDYVLSGFVHVGALVEQRFGRRAFTDIAWHLFLRGQRGDIFNRALKDIGIAPKPYIIQELVDVYRNHRPTISLAEDAVQCLDFLRSRYQLALITDGPVAAQRNKVCALGLEKKIPIRILTGEWSIAFSKPHVKAFLSVQEQAGVNSSECMYVADNPRKDFAAPARLGWKTVRIRRSGGLHSEVASEAIMPNREFNTLIPLIDMCSEPALGCV
jgi:putative hydrolase of the HAD superfamily